MRSIEVNARWDGKSCDERPSPVTRCSQRRPTRLARARLTAENQITSQLLAKPSSSRRSIVDSAVVWHGYLNNTSLFGPPKAPASTSVKDPAANMAQPDRKAASSLGQRPVPPFDLFEDSDSTISRARRYGRTASSYRHPPVSPFGPVKDLAGNPAQPNRKATSIFNTPEIRALAIVARVGSSRMASSVVVSPLFKLSAELELRNMIYRYALISELRIVIAKTMALSSLPYFSSVSSSAPKLVQFSTPKTISPAE